MKTRPILVNLKDLNLFEAILLLFEKGSHFQDRNILGYCF